MWLQINGEGHEGMLDMCFRWMFSVLEAVWLAVQIPYIFITFVSSRSFFRLTTCQWRSFWLTVFMLAHIRSYRNWRPFWRQAIPVTTVRIDFNFSLLPFHTSVCKYRTNLQNPVAAIVLCQSVKQLQRLKILLSFSALMFCNYSFVSSAVLERGTSVCFCLFQRSSRLLYPHLLFQYLSRVVVQSVYIFLWTFILACSSLCCMD